MQNSQLTSMHPATPSASHSVYYQPWASPAVAAASAAWVAPLVRLASAKITPK